MNQEQNSQFLGQEKIAKLMLKFSVPCVLSLLVSALYNIVDQVFIGNSDFPRSAMPRPGWYSRSSLSPRRSPGASVTDVPPI